MVYAYSWDSFISAVKQFGNFEAPFAEQNLQLIFNEIKFLEDLGEHTPQTLQYILSLASKLGADFPKAIEAAKTIWNKCLLVSNNADESWWISSYGAITEYVPDFLKEKVGSHYGVLECRMGPHYIYSTILEELNKKSSLISAGPDNFLEIVDNMDIRYRIKKITSNRVQIKSESDTNLQSYLFSMPPELVSGYPEIVSKLVEGMPILKYGDAHKLNECYRVAFRYRNNPKLLDIVLEHFDSADPLTFNLLEYLIYIKMPDKRLEELLENGEEPAMEDLMTSYRSGKPADIRRFKPEYREVYIELFKSLDKVLLSNGLRSKCFQTLNFEAFLSDLQKMDAIDALELIEYASFPLPPEIKDFLRFKFMSAWVSNNPDFNGMFEEYCADEHIEVTLKNVRNINHLFELLEYATIFPTPNTKILNNTLAANFPDYIYPNSKKERTNWLISRLIIDELDPSKIASVAELSSYLELMEKVKKVENNELLDEMAARLDGLNLDQLVNFGDQKQQAMLYDIEALEKIRKNFNSMIGRTFGDQLVEQAGISFLESHPASFVNLNNLLGFAGAWSAPHKTRSNKNEAGLYQQFSYFAYGLIADFVRSRLKEKDYDEAKFEEECHAMSNMPCYSLIDDLEALGFAIRKESNASKVANRILTHTSYTVSRGVSKVFGDGDVVENQSGLQFKPARWPAKDGVEVKIVYQGEKELAKIIKCNRSSKVRILVEKERSVDVKAVETELGKKYIFSAPLSMTTSNGKLIEPAFRDGVQMNWLLTQGGNDGLLVVDSNGNPQILDKREIKLGNILNADDVSGKNQVLTALSKWLKRAKSADVVSTAILDDKISPSENLWDRILFFEILKIKKYSMLGGLLLMSDNELSALQDGSASRRFYVEFEDGDFGIIDSTENMSSADMLEISLMAGVRKAIYMDTGLYDNATYQDGRGGKHALGYHDSEDSTNRVVIYSQE
ncbi:MAG: hypothetical protein HYY43_04855 [Deltaproteobacteria bacterium]|nr:hypothetical protein [Deltaproteobacteria bacterium]